MAGALIGMAAKVLLPALESRDDAFAAVVESQLHAVLAGLVLAAALAAVMSTSSGALIATATVFSQDIVARLRGRDVEAGSEHDHVRSQPALRGRLRDRHGASSPACCRTWSPR